MSSKDKITAVARYIEGDMEAEEVKEFEIQLQQDAELRELEAQYQDIHQTLKMQLAPSLSDRQVVETLAGLNQQYFKKEAKVVSMKSSIKYISIAAVLIIGLFVWAPWSANLYNQYSFSKQMSVAERGSNQQNELAKAAVLFNKGDYAGARKIMQREYMGSPQNPLLAYYFSITLIETGKEYEARTILMNLHNGSSVFKYDAAFYVALSFIKEDQPQEASAWLAKIPADNANYAKAQELMGKLKK